MHTMQVFILTHAEAANGQVWANLQAFLQAQGQNPAYSAGAGVPAQVFHCGPDNEAVPAPIGVDAPNVGTPPAGEVFGVGGDLPQQVFGAHAAPQPLPGAPSTAGAGQWPTAPVAQSLPLNPGAAQTDANQTHAVAPAPVALAPLAPAAPMNHAGGVETDSEGLPWDPRIHSGGKKKNAGDGKWTAKRGINDPALVERVKAELRAVMAAPGGAPTAMLGQTAPMPQTVAAPPVLTQPAPLLPNVAPVQTAPQAPAAPLVSAPAMPAAVPPLPNPGTVAVSAATAPGAAPGGETFAQFMQRLAPYTSTGQITPEAIARAAATVGVGLPMLRNRPDLIPAFAQALGLPPQ